MQTHSNSNITQDEQILRELIAHWVDASQKKDLDAVMQHYAEDVVAFDAVGAIRFIGLQDYREHWKVCFEYCQGDMVFEMSDLKLSIDGDLAFGHYLIRCGGADETGEIHTGWMRGTVCFRRLASEWRVVHEHLSAPFDPVSCKAQFDAP